MGLGSHWLEGMTCSVQALTDGLNAGLRLSLARLGGWVCLTVLCGPLWAADSRSWDVPGAPPPPAYEVWQPEEGWVPNPVTSIVQSHDGYLWVGTYQGLVRFDGVRFASYDSIRTRGLRNSRITALYEDRKGELWVGHETGELSRMAGGQFRAANLQAGWPGGSIESIVTDMAGDFWIMNESGVLFRLRDGKKAEPPGGPSPNRHAALSQDASGRIWMVSSGVVVRLEGDEFVRMKFPDAADSDYYERVAPARGGGLWIIGNGHIRKWVRDSWEVDLGEYPWGQGRTITAMVETRAGSVVVGTFDGVYLFTPGSETLHFSRVNGLSHDWVRWICEDHEGNIWLGTGAGLNALRPRKAKMLDPPDHWQGRTVLSFSVQPDGAAWIGTEGAGLYHYDKGGWTTYRESSGLTNLFVWAALETRRGDLFVGTWGGGCVKKQGDRFEPVGDLARITAPVVSLFEGQGGEVWIGTTIGVYRYEGGKLTWFAGKDQLALPDVRAMAQSPDGTMWFGMSGGGLVSLKEGRLKQYRKVDGLPSDFVQCLYTEPDGTLWIGTSDNGLGCYYQGRFRAISPGAGLPPNVISHIVDDGLGHFWIGSNRGVFRVGKADLHEYMEGGGKPFRALGFSKAEGLGSPMCSGGFQPGACRTTQGFLWFPTSKGIAQIDPVNVAFNTHPPPVVIEGLMVEGESVESANPAVENGEERAPARLQIAPGAQHFELRYTALSFAAPEKVRFRHKLEGLERDWTAPSPERVAQYVYLPPGDYAFHVQACNNDEVWNEEGAGLAFTVLPRWDQTWWFRAAATLAGGGMVAAAAGWMMRRRVRHKLELLERQRALERERARIARDIHDDLGASLTHITLLSQSARSELAENHAAAADMDRIYSTARELTRAMDEIVWAVNPKHDTLDSLVAYLGRFGQNFLTGTGVRCRLDVPVQLPAWTLTSEIRHNVFLACKEAFNNILKHAGATEVRISLELLSKGFVLVVADNGQGFDPAVLAGRAAGAADPSRAASGNGLQNMRRRLAEVGGHCDWDTAPAEGTRVRMTVQLQGTE